MGSIIPGPVPPYNNPPIEPQYFKPRKYFIQGVILGYYTTITTIVPHDYVIGQEVRLLIPPTNGCRQLNHVKGFVISIPTSTSILTSINSLVNVDPFVSTSNPNQPQILAIGDINTGIISSTGATIPSTNIPGAFINISPL